MLVVVGRLCPTPEAPTVGVVPPNAILTAYVSIEIITPCKVLPAESVNIPDGNKDAESLATSLCVAPTTPKMGIVLSISASALSVS
jgi:hypothetical protein